MNEKVNNESGDILPDDFTGMDDGLAGSSEDAYDGDYTIQTDHHQQVISAGLVLFSLEE